MRRAVLGGTIAVVLVLATAAYAAFIQCDGGPCQGTAEADDITGDKQGDQIFAGAGDDDVDARTGHDFVRGAAGIDVVKGGGGEDTLRGHRGGDELDGGPGDDFIFGHGNPTPDPGSGDGPFSEDLNDNAPNDADVVYGGSGFEFINLVDGDGDDYADCGEDEGVVVADTGDATENCQSL